LDGTTDPETIRSLLNRELPEGFLVTRVGQPLAEASTPITPRHQRNPLAGRVEPVDRGGQ
jgi:hypothetical protein